MRYNKFALVLSIVMSCTSVSAQTQQGYVKTKGRLGNNGSVIAGTRLSGATVMVKGCNAVVSGNNGSFSLSVPKNNYFLQNVQKLGYVLTDPDILSKQYAYSKNPLVLVMETPSQQVDDKLAVEKMIRRTLRRQLQEKEDEIEALKEQQKLSEEEYRKQLQEIYALQKSNERLISEMADHYSKMDFDEVDDFNCRISDCIINGRLIEADSLLSTKGDINSRAATLRQRQEANAQAEKELTVKLKKLEKSKAMTQKELEDLARDCYSKFEIFKMQHQNDSAAYYIELRASLDTTKLEWLLEAGKYLQKYLARYQEAENLFFKALQCASAANNSSNYQLVHSYAALASLYSTKGELEKALEYYNMVYDMSTSLFEVNHQDVIAAMINLANIYRKKGEYDKAIDLSSKAADIMNESDDISIAIKAKTYGAIANLYNSRNMYSKALEFLLKTYTLISSDMDKYPLEIITTFVNIGHTYYELGDYDLALEWDNKALQIIEKVLGRSHPDMSTILANIGGVFLKRNNPQKTLENMKQALQIDKEVYGQYSPNLIIDYNNLGMIEYTLDNCTEALDYYQKALELCVKNLPENHPYFATIYNNIGSVYLKLDQQEDLALEYFNKALQLRIKKFGEKNSSVAMVYNNIAKIYQKKEETEKAITYFEKAKVIFEETLSPNHPNTKAVQEAIDTIKSNKK